MFWVGFQVRPVLDPWEQQEVAAVPGDESVEVQQTEQSAVDLAAQGYLSLEELTVRIDDGDVQWFDGVMWHTVAPVEELAKEDKFYAAQEGVRELEEQLKQQREDRRAEQESVAERGETLLVGQKEDPKPTEKPKPTKPTVTAPAPVIVPELVPEPTAAPENSGGGNSGGGNSGGGNSGGGNSGGGDGGNSGGGNSGGGDGGNTGDSGNSGGGDSGNTGDSGNSGGGDSGNTGDSGNSGGGDSGNTGDSGNSGGGDSGGDTGDGENMEWSDDYL